MGFANSLYSLDVGYGEVVKSRLNASFSDLSNWKSRNNIKYDRQIIK